LFAPGAKHSFHPQGVADGPPFGARSPEADDSPNADGSALPDGAAAPLDPAFVARIRESLDDPRPSIPAAQVRAHLKALHEARLKRG